MGKASQFFWFMQADKVPSLEEMKLYYSNISPELRNKLIELRQKYRKIYKNDDNLERQLNLF